MAYRAKLGIALGGGGARGIAHVGVLKVLERENIFPDFIAGTSIGALVGAAYAANPRIDKLEKKVIEVLAPDSPNKIPLQNLDWVNWQESLKPNWISRLTRTMHKEMFLLLAVLRTAVLSVDDLRACVEAFLPAIDIAETAIPFAAVTTDLITGRQVVLTEGPIITAVMASCAVPGFMPPIHLNGKILVDGGIVNTLPADVVRAAGAQTVVGVDAGMALCQPFQVEDGIDVINRCTEIMAIRLGEINLKYADLLIPLNTRDVNWMHFQDCEKLIQEGQKAAESMIERIKTAVAPPFYRRLLHPFPRTRTFQSRHAPGSYRQ
jgi:NTE family protein